MKLVALLSLGVLAIASATNVALIPTVQAESRTPAEATAHAVDELANAIAQGKITFTPAPTATATQTPTSTSTPVPTDVPTALPTATPLPPLPVPDAAAGPLAGYVRPSTLPDPAVLELALPQGRWDIRLAPDTCQELVATWTDVLLVRSDLGPALVDRAYFTDQHQWGPCAIAQAGWHADAPCAAADDGTCGANTDPVLIVALGDPEPTPVPAVASTAAPVPPPAPAPRQAAAAAAPVREVVVQTVVVLVTAVPADAPTPAPAAPPAVVNATARDAPTATGLPSGATATTVPALVRQGAPRPTVELVPTEPAAAVVELPPAPATHGLTVTGWLLLGLFGCGAVAMTVALFARRKRSRRFAP